MELSQQTFQELAQRIHRLCGLVIGQEKAYLVRHRLEPVVISFGMEGFEQLLQRLQVRAEVRLQDAIIDAITTKETSFFRDQAFFQAIQQHVLPERAKCLNPSRATGQSSHASPPGSGARRHRIRIWSAGSSTGQEAYSLAMLVRDFVEASNGPHARGSRRHDEPDGSLDSSRALRDSHFTILASDISAEALEAAQAGRYNRAEVARGLSENLLERHFKVQGKHWTVSEPVRCLVQFRRFNLLHPPAELGAFDLILCRNVLIYFDEPTRKKVCRALYEVLHHGGWLALGAAESLYGIEDRMESVKVGKVLLYRKSD